MAETDRPTWLRAIVGLVVISAMLSLIYWREIRTSDIFQRHFDSVAWESKQKAIAARAAAYRELDARECLIMLRAKAELVPIETERYRLAGISEVESARRAADDFELERETCASMHAIP